MSLARPRCALAAAASTVASAAVSRGGAVAAAACSSAARPRSASILATTSARCGDSGSLMVEDVTTSPGAVGLLYAGSSTSAIANPISEVLQFLSTKLRGSATMVGN